MKRLILLAVSALILSNTGCFHHFTRNGQHAGHHGPSCGCGSHARLGGHGALGSQGLLGGLAGTQPPGAQAHASHGPHDWRHQQAAVGPAGPPVATVGYPYYTLRGPRDFLLDNPPPLGN